MAFSFSFFNTASISDQVMKVAGSSATLAGRLARERLSALASEASCIGSSTTTATTDGVSIGAWLALKFKRARDLLLGFATVPQGGVEVVRQRQSEPKKVDSEKAELEAKMWLLGGLKKPGPWFFLQHNSCYL